MHLKTLCLVLLYFSLIAAIHQQNTNLSRNLISQTIKSLSKSRCTPHLVFFQQSYQNSVEWQLIQGIPIQITYFRKTCYKTLSLASKPESFKCMKSIQKTKTKFIKPISNRNFEQEVCNTLLFLWPDIEHNLEILEQTWWYLSFFDHLYPTEDFRRQILFSSSNFGRLYFIFFVKFFKFSSMEKTLFPWTTRLGKQNLKTELSYKILPHNSFIYVANINKIFGITNVLQLKCSHIYTHVIAINNIITKPQMDSFLRDLSRLKTIHIIDEKTKKNVEISERRHFRFGEPGKNEIKKTLFSSLILSKISVNVTVSVQPTVEHLTMIIRKPHAVFIRYTSLVDRLKNVRRRHHPYLNGFLTFPFGTGRINGHLCIQRIQTFNFITCDGSQTVLSYTWTFSPMQWQVWIATLVSNTGIVLILEMVFAQNVSWFLFANILEQSHSLWDKISPDRINVSRLILGSYLLAAIILTNGITSTSFINPWNKVELSSCN